ncbi:formamidopyrimidine-DNA glycosylase [Spiroplasma helicoides]|uniref:Formamidopyrimidine-DNA glycosylase n=1 Tax=Spiroplasma helicoides TaxID=216938 RepID=A0A1B3SLE4_9MOLU|nr:DNA-formamidopyrimidine glycosylase [Spiroplasma helicoides]AOG60743.1 formamidopyrimidine-DNA glycosylase [Spiroplasma helicoides]
MPELPEVETVVRTLRKKVVGLKIIEAQILYPKIIKSDISVDDFEEDLKNRTIEKISRIAKHIIFHLGDVVLISHLRMEGKWFIYDKNDSFDKKHILAIFKLSNEKLMCYQDTRKFGTFHYQGVNEYLNLNPIAKIGLEPLDMAVQGKYLYDLMAKSSKYIKTILLDQTLISGIGNIYADEILFDASISPLNKGNDLNVEMYQRIADSSRKILKKSIDMGGTTIDSYQPEQGIDGKFQNELKVHTRKNEPCYKCGQKVIKIKLNGRGTYYCEKCQS